MEFPDMNPTGRSPRRELQGPRPTPLRINKDSHKIKKPPLAPPPQQSPSHHQAPPLPPRQPIIIYTVSPKIIHTTPGDFMSLVQRLTGSSSSSSSSNNNAYPSSSMSSSTFPASASTSDVALVPNNDPFNVVPAEMVSPAARYAAIEKARSPVGKNKIMIHQNQAIMNGGNQIITTNNNNNSEVVEGLEMMMMGSHGVTTTNNMFQAGILSPGPASLSPIPSSFFSPLPSSSSDPSMVSFFHDLSPMLHNSASAFVMPSPSNFVSPQTPTIDLFNYFLD
ncbi:hypothetical protein PIB30_048437 [Stylosanthes scabra]|uniref:VQ domain-containing protein n=1 Tax=Stylosanthes scabra TaxID=79078 RepID=A0ABU6VFW5_9FABA|nr:hypothetical protein [Stylosanthes scabra]